MTVQNLAQRERRRLISLFFFVLCLYLLTSGGHLYGQDGVSYFFMAEGLSLRGWPSIPLNINTLGGKVGRDGLYYAPYGPGQPLAAVPLFALGFHFTETTSYKYMAAFFVSFFNSFVTACTAFVLALFLRHLGHSTRSSVAVALLYSFATLAWPYAHYFYSEPLVSLCTLSGLYFLVHSLDKAMFQWQQYAFVSLAGFIFGCAILTRPVTVVCLPLFFIFLVILLKKNGSPSVFSKTLCFTAPVIMCALLIAWYNWYRFGNVFDQGYGPLPDGRLQTFSYPFFTGLYVLLFSPGKSIFLYSPPLLLSLFHARCFIRKHGLLSVLIGLLSLLYLLMYANWCQIEGGFSWGPRFLVPLLPLLLMPMVIFFEQHQPRKLLIFSGVILVFSVFFQLGISSINYLEVLERGKKDYYDQQTGLYNPFYSPFEELLELYGEKTDWSSDKTKHSVEARKYRKSLYVINMDWSAPLDYWFVHLHGDGFPLVLLGCVLFCLISIVILSGFFLFPGLFASGS